MLLSLHSCGAFFNGVNSNSKRGALGNLRLRSFVFEPNTKRKRKGVSLHSHQPPLQQPFTFQTSYRSASVWCLVRTPATSYSYSSTWSHCFWMLQCLIALLKSLGSNRASPKSTRFVAPRILKGTNSIISPFYTSWFKTLWTSWMELGH